MNKLLLITGGGTGIGRAISNYFNKEGYSVVIVYSKSKKESEETLLQFKRKDENSNIFKSDVTSEQDIQSLFNFIYENYGKIDTLVNCAGWTKFIEDDNFVSIDKTFFQKIIDINLIGSFLMIKTMLPLLEKGSTPNIINIASTAGLTGIGSNVAYSASKAGVINLTKSLSRILDSNIRVNCVSPGLTETRLTKDWKSYKKSIIAQSPSGRLVDINDIAKAVYSLAEERIKISGECVVIDTIT